jgi:hypothetical protein
MYTSDQASGAAAMPANIGDGVRHKRRRMASQSRPGILSHSQGSIPSHWSNPRRRIDVYPEQGTPGDLTCLG